MEAEKLSRELSFKRLVRRQGKCPLPAFCLAQNRHSLLSPRHSAGVSEGLLPATEASSAESNIDTVTTLLSTETCGLCVTQMSSFPWETYFSLDSGRQKGKRENNILFKVVFVNCYNSNWTFTEKCQYPLKVFVRNSQKVKPAATIWPIL